MNADIQAKLDAIKAVFQPIVEAADAVPALVDAAELAKYNQGVVDGKAMIQVGNPGDPANIYSQAQMDAAVSAGKAQQASQDKADLDAANAKSSDLQAKVDAGVAAQADLQSKFDALVAKVKDVESKLLNELGA